jgi:hypothetical protein
MSANTGISAFPEGDNLLQWIGTIEGPAGTVRSVFLLSLAGISS